MNIIGIIGIDNIENIKKLYPLGYGFFIRTIDGIIDVWQAISIILWVRNKGYLLDLWQRNIFV
jgi:hypothetical protein